MNQFRYATIITHVATGTSYVVIEEPNPNHRLELSGETYYKYLSLESGLSWIRSKEETEDGRFV